MPNISRSKVNQAMKFGQLLEYNMRNIFVEKSYIKWGGETIPRPFSEKSKLSISLDSYIKWGGETIPRPFSKKSKLSISLDQKSESFIEFTFIVCKYEGYRIEI